MRGRKAAQTNFICLVNVEDRIPKGHPIREVNRLIGDVFRRLDPEFEDLYSQQGRASRRSVLVLRDAESLQKFSTVFKRIG